LFSVPRLELRVPASEPEEPAPTRLTGSDANLAFEILAAEPGVSLALKPRPAPDQMTLQTDAASLATYRRLEALGCFTRREPPSENVFVRALDNTFRPEVIRLGRTTKLSCSLVTAIKRRNPLCLLNPVVLNLSW
jgi:hypothetical protein